jgi:hypothetical protein
MENKIKRPESVEEMRRMWAEYDLEQAMISGETFLRQATLEQREDVKQLLVEVLSGEIASGSSLALGWLEEYRDPDLVPLVLELLQHGRVLFPALHVLATWARRGVISPRDPKVVEPLKVLLPQVYSAEYPDNWKAVMSALEALEAVDAIDLMAGYLHDPVRSVRAHAMYCIIPLIKATGREDILESVVQLLEDPHPDVRTFAAGVLKASFPDRFQHLDLEDYLRPPIPWQGESDVAPEV